MRAVLLGIALIGAACGAPGDVADGSVTGPFAPGISGGALAGSIEVIAIDELTREPVEATITLEPEGLEPVSGDSPFVHRGAAPFDRADVTVHAVSAGRDVRIHWVGVRGARVVVAVPRREVRRVDVDVRGAPGGTSAIEVTTLAPLHIVRSASVGGPSASCASLDACRVSLDVPAGASTLVASASGAEGALGFAMGDLDGSSIDFDVATRAVVSIEAPLPLPGPGLDAVVGVPGVTEDGLLARLPPARAATFVVPALDGDLAQASWWLLARADGPGRSSTIVQRGLRDSSDGGAWPPFLDAPQLELDAGRVVSARPPPGATLLVIERIDGASEDSTLYLDVPAQLDIAPGASAGVIVRAIDAGPVDASALDLDAIERAVVRWSESTGM